ncbi:MAG: hypothetical protein AB7L09_26525 [Nitrospira sp.]
MNERSVTLWRMAEEPKELADQFLRQRRNLIIGCLVILFLETTVSPPDKLSILGVELKITNSAYVIYWLWVFTGYWLIRFFQYMPSLALLRERASGEFMRSLRKALKRQAEHLLREKRPRTDNELHKRFLNVQHIYFPARLGVAHITFAVHAEGFRNVQTGKVDTKDILDGHPGKSITGLRAIGINVIAACDLCVRTPFLTEYVVPVLLFLVALGSSAHRLF